MSMLMANPPLHTQWQAVATSDFLLIFAYLGSAEKQGEEISTLPAFLHRFPYLEAVRVIFLRSYKGLRVERSLFAGRAITVRKGEILNGYNGKTNR